VRPGTHRRSRCAACELARVRRTRHDRVGIHDFTDSPVRHRIYGRGHDQRGHSGSCNHGVVTSRWETHNEDQAAVHFRGRSGPVRRNGNDPQRQAGRSRSRPACVCELQPQPIPHWRQCEIHRLSSGTHSITAIAVVFPSPTPNISNPIEQTVQGALTTTTVTGAPSPPTVFGQGVTFTAAVAANVSSVGTPTGSVQFTDNAPTSAAAKT
jgi:hypothetical protein